MKHLTDDETEDLLTLFDMIELWAINSRGVARLYEENKTLIEGITKKICEQDTPAQS